MSFILDRIKTGGAIAPQEFSGSTPATSANIVRGGAQSAIVIVSNAAATGSPSAASLTLSFVDGPTTSPANAVTFETAPAAINALTAGVSIFNVDIRGFDTNFKVTATPAFTGGSSPKIVADCVVLLTDVPVDPANGATTIYRKVQ
jgi:hypothetical protein